MWDWLLSGPKTKNIPADPLKAYPSAEDAQTARAGGYGYGDPNDAYIEGKAGSTFGGFKKGGKVDPFVPVMPRGTVARTFDTPKVNMTGQSGISSGLLADNQDAWTRASLASNYVPVAALGLDGRNFTGDLSGKNANIAGMYRPGTDQGMFSSGTPSSLLHESAHRGLAMLKDQPGVPEWIQQRIGGPAEEGIVRHLMQRYAGDPEQGPMDIEQKRAAPDISKDGIAQLNAVVARMMQERRPRGPR